MTRPNFWSKSAPRVELDHRARDARVRLVQTERLLVPRGPVASRLSAFSALAQEVNGETAVGATGRKATRASTVCQISRHDGWKLGRFLSE
jgi:hypothetical protein